MAGNIKGITIEFRGDTTKLDKALRQINNETRAIDRELKQVDKALKFNPSNVELWRQKQQLLAQKISETNEKLKLLKDAQKQMDASGVDKTSEEYRNLQREIITTESQVKTFETQLRKIGNVNLRATSEQFKEIGNKLTAAGHAMREVSMAGAAVVGVLGTMAYKAGKAADDLNTMSKIYGISTQDLQKYKLAADQVDVSVETIAKSHVRLEKNMYSAKDGTGTAAEAFKTLGVAVTNADGSLRNGDQVWQDTIAALGNMENETERDALAMQLMGKSAAELNPLIEDGGETYKRTAELFSKYNLDLIDQDTLERANEFNDSIDDIKSMGTLAFSMLGAKLADYLLPVMEKVVNVVGKFVGWLGNLDPKVLAIIGAIAGVVSVLAPLLIVLGKVAFAISSIMSLMSTLGITFAALAGPVGIAIAIIAALIAIGILLYKNWDTIKAKAKDLWKSLTKTFDNIKKSITKTWDEIKKFLTKTWDVIKAVAKVAWEAIKAVIFGPMNILFTLLRSNWDSIKSFLTNIWNSIKSTASSVWNAISSTASLVWNAIKTTITTIVQGIATTLSNIWNSIKSTVSSVFSSIQSTASSIWNSIKNAITSPIQSAYSTVSSVVSSIRSAVSSAFSSIQSSASSQWNSIKNAITSPIQTAYNTVSGIVSKVKSLFPISIGRLLSNISLPHFSLSWSSKSFGKLGKISYPTGLNVSWYDKGGIFNNPTVIGVGEKRPEFVGALDDLRKIVREESGGHGEATYNFYITGDDPKAIAQEVKRILIQETKREQRAYGI